MNRYRVAFTKGEPVRYISHLDLSKLFQRALRRGKLPIAYSEGFNPHPKLSLGSALRLGISSCCEYLDVEFTERIDLEEIKDNLQKNLPHGITVTSVLEIPQEAPSAMALINAASYRLSCKKVNTHTKAETVLAELLVANELIVERDAKNGPKKIDLRPLIHQVEVISDTDQTAVFQLLLAASDQGTARPEELGQLLTEKGFCQGEGNIQIQRTGLFRMYPDGAIRTPFQVLTKESMVKPV